ncbi:MAG: hypothetical protein KGP35_01670 [Bacteroidetes bacterium]|nr:hypothetical protein [Bacteroidota bacterium]
MRRSFAQAQDDGWLLSFDQAKEMPQHSMWQKNNNKYHIKVTIKLDKKEPILRTERVFMV